ncbi:MAG: site-2 protease family protein [Acidobacteriota bacterium]|nr:site-2 protease family protein [Acidobacteriota bacterium]
MNLQHVDIFFQSIVFLFAISVHESAHAWMANRCGDPTARLLGRITLNPLKHIDPVGTVLLPLLGILTGLPVFGWAKPTPVNPLNFKNHVRDDILTSVVGPVSNFIIASGAVLILAVIAFTSAPGGEVVRALAGRQPVNAESLLTPIALLFYQAMFINVVLGVFNLIPIPPLDGSHVLRHVLPEPIRNVYDTLGILGLIALVMFGGKIIWGLVTPVVGLFNALLMRM